MNSEANSDSEEKYVVLLESARHALTLESERKKNLEARAGVLAGFNGLALVTVLTDTTKVFEIGVHAFNELTFDAVVFTPIVKLPIFTQLAPVISMFCFGVAIIGLTVSMYKFVQVVGSPREYRGVDLKALVDFFIQKSDYGFYMWSVGSYHNTLETNRQLTEEKFKIFGLASKIMITSICFLVGWYIFYHICLAQHIFPSV